MELYKIGAELGQLKSVKALTDVTGFGLLGHLAEMCEGSNLNAEIEFSKVPKILEAEQYRLQKAIPGGTNRNFDSYGHKVGALTDEQKQYLCDPQTSGGLLVAVEPKNRKEVLEIFANFGLQLEPFGKLTEATGATERIQVK